MKNIKYLGFVGLGCTLLLTGCVGESSDSNTDKKPEARCTVIKSNGNGSIYAYFTNGKVSNIDVEYNFNSQDIADSYCSEFKENHKNKADISCNGKKVTIKNYPEGEAEDAIGLTYGEFIKYFQDNGWVCM